MLHADWLDRVGEHRLDQSYQTFGSYATFGAKLKKPLRNTVLMLHLTVFAFGKSSSMISNKMNGCHHRVLPCYLVDCQLQPRSHL